MYKAQKDTKCSDVDRLLALLELKISEKFEKLNQAYKFFAGITTSKISFNDFVIGLENLRMKLATRDITAMFEALDSDRDGYISYVEFCNLSEERRRGIDPYETQNKKDAFNGLGKSRQNMRNRTIDGPLIIDPSEGKISIE